MNSSTGLHRAARIACIAIVLGSASVVSRGDTAWEYTPGGLVQVSVVSQGGYVYDAATMVCIGSVDGNGYIWSNGVIVAYMPE